MTKSNWTLIAAFLVVSLATLACSVCFTHRGSPPPAAVEATVVREPTDTPGSEPDLPPQPEPTATETQVMVSAPTEEPGFGIGSTMVNPVDGALMVYVPAGEFLMGYEDADAVYLDLPERMVYLDAFWIYQHPVTNSQYRACVDIGECRAPGDLRNYSDPDYDDHPVVFVNWFDADAYCQWAGVQLPTEAEWEKAARGTDGRKYPWGDQDPTCSLANYTVWFDPCVGETTPVGSYPDSASPYGALDMAGNVWEWVADLADAGYGESGIVRGGSWNYDEFYLRVSYRLEFFTDTETDDLGFRCLFTAVP